MRRGLAFSAAERSRIINVDANKGMAQPCSQFAIHDELKLLKDLYEEGKLLFFANTGLINTAEMDKFNYKDVTRSPLFAHNVMQEEVKSVDPYKEIPGTGVLGRLAEKLTERGFKTNSIAIDNPSVAITPPRDGDSPASFVVSRLGASEFYERYEDPNRVAEIHDYVYKLNNQTDIYSNFFGEAWSEQLMAGIPSAVEIKVALDQTTLGGQWPEDGSDPDQKLAMIARLMQTKDIRGVDRDFFYTHFGGFDHHDDLKKSLRPKFRELNGALTRFRDELVAQGLWNDVAIVVTSDFARTLTPNGNQGSDHAWGGNYFMMGGKVDGGKILGRYPSDLSESGDLNIGRGRFLPTTSWDCIWNGVCEWMGATSTAELDYCLPNRHNVVGGTNNMFTDMFHETDLFQQSARRLRGGSS